ncbi:MAG: UDP-N-acetylglucosamine pyrophosphorylase [Verrucomicrobiales bacterium]
MTKDNDDHPHSAAEPTAFSEIEAKMRAVDLSDAAIASFRENYAALCRNETGLISEALIEPADSLPLADTLEASPNAQSLLSETVVIKLNGGLGTGMGLEKAKSLLKVKDDNSFLDFIAQQILFMRGNTGSDLRFLLMNSFSTSADTLDYLNDRYPELGEELDFLQNKVPKIDAATLQPVAVPENPEMEWCPPGHGDIYAALAGSGWLKRLLAAGVRYAFVSNSDNLGATLDLALLDYFAKSDQPFLMEVTRRTPSDRKGGHLARFRDGGQLLLRESAQCPDDDIDAFQDIDRHRYFNTNNIWFRLDHLQEALDANGGFLPLPMIKNRKTADPRDPKSPAVFQLETAMGAAIQCFEKAGAIEVGRHRFAPVKTTSDLLVLRSDACVQTPDFRLELAPELNGVPPTVKLDGGYKMLDGLEAALTESVPSLVECQSLQVNGAVVFSPGTIFRGDVVIDNNTGEPKLVPAGAYEDEMLDLR